MFAKFFQSLYAYNTWANQRVLDTAAKLTKAQFTGKHLATYGSIRTALVHCVTWQQIWIERCAGRPASPVLRPQRFPDVARLVVKWREVDEITRSFINQQSDADL
jgi:uncharacterized damage-inducible protein DinB